MSGLKQLIQEIHGRSLWQVVGIYLVASWVVFQVIQTLTEGLGLPEWFPALALVLLLIGLLIVLATAFVQEGVRPAGVPAEPTPIPGDATGGAAAPEEGRRREAGGARLFTWRNAITGGVGIRGADRKCAQVPKLEPLRDAVDPPGTPRR